MRNKLRWTAVAVGMLSGIMLLSGCETLAKKFTRKRKTSVNQETMVIVPRDYSAHPFPSDVLYKQYFIYWKSWNQELVASLNDAGNYKKIDDCVTQSLVNLRKMQSYLKEEQAGALQEYIGKTESLKNNIEQARYMPPSRMNLLRYDADRILSNVNRKFDLKKMKEYLK